MTPTAKLRFVEREMAVPHKQYENVSIIRSVRVLQQWWVDEWLSGEWRDVPLEEEE